MAAVGFPSTQVSDKNTTKDSRGSSDKAGEVTTVFLRLRLQKGREDLMFFWDHNAQNFPFIAVMTVLIEPSWNIQLKCDSQVAMRWDLLQSPKKVAVSGILEEPWIFTGHGQSPEDRVGKSKWGARKRPADNTSCVQHGAVRWLDNVGEGTVLCADLPAELLPKHYTDKRQQPSPASELEHCNWWGGRAVFFQAVTHLSSQPSLPHLLYDKGICWKGGTAVPRGAYRS